LFFFLLEEVVIVMHALISYWLHLQLQFFIGLCLTPTRSTYFKFFFVLLAFVVGFNLSLLDIE
jgi:hypothetical protein